MAHGLVFRDAAPIPDQVGCGSIKAVRALEKFERLGAVERPTAAQPVFGNWIGESVVAMTFPHAPQGAFC
jgi:hypothetical protein